jgi:meso-butanediol dehydrogenase / (S,S)-butanediol dehydrogenase / diacetyl reductase
MRLKNKIAVITGAAAGLGFATTKLFFEEGAFIIGLDLNEPPEALQRQVFNRSDKVLFKKIDITDSESVKELSISIAEKYGRVDILVNNAGINATGNIEETTEEEFNRTINVNVFGTFVVTKYFIPLLKKNLDGGSIINVASNIGLTGMAGRIAYTTSKGAIVNFTRSMAMDYAKNKIRINAIAPGGINTDMVIDFFKQYSEDFKQQVYAMHALNRLAEPEEIAKGILFLASDESSYATGSVLVIDGGYTCGK